MKKQLTIGVLLLALLGLGGFSYFNNSNDQSPVNEVDTQVVEQQERSAIEIVPDGKSVSYDGVEGETALKTMSELTDVSTESSDFGEFVTAINGLAADSTNEYWAFYVNGELASVGAGSYTSMQGDKIEWKLENL